MADLVSNALLNAVQSPAKKKRRPTELPKTDKWKLSMKVRNYGKGLCIVCETDYEKKSSKAKYCADCRLNYKALWAANNATRVSAAKKERYQTSKESEARKSRDWYLRNKEKVIAKAASRRVRQMETDPEVVRAYNRERMRIRRAAKPDEVRRHRREYAAARRTNDPAFRLNDLIGRAVRRGLKAGKAGKSWKELVPFSIEDLMAHLETKFQPGMTWENHGRGKDCWHIDHIVPVSAHSFETPDDPDFKRCWALTNLQPLWEIDNLKKGNKPLDQFLLRLS